MNNPYFLPSLPKGEQLPCSDDTPVDNENQNFIPNLLLFLLKLIWKNRHDWFFGVDMGIYQNIEVLYWYNQQGQRYLTAEERAIQAEQQLERYRQLFGELP